MKKVFTIEFEFEWSWIYFWNGDGDDNDHDDKNTWWWYLWEKSMIKYDDDHDDDNDNDDKNTGWWYLWEKAAQNMINYDDDDNDNDDSDSREEYSTEYIFHSSCIWSHTDNSYPLLIRTLSEDDDDGDDDDDEHKWAMILTMIWSNAEQNAQKRFRSAQISLTFPFSRIVRWLPQFFWKGGGLSVKETTVFSKCLLQKSEHLLTYKCTMSRW